MSISKVLLLTLFVGVGVSGTFGQEPPAGKPFRPPAVPLVTSDPYLSIWSEADHLNDDVTRHWTRHPHSLVSLIRIDGKAYRVMGNEPKDVEPLPQTGVVMLPTRSIYQFENSQIHLTLTFMTAALPHDLEVFARPLSYITWEVKSADGKPHAVSIYDSTSSQLAVNTPKQKVEWSRETMGDLTALKVGARTRITFRPWAMTRGSIGAMPMRWHPQARPNRPSVQPLS